MTATVDMTPRVGEVWDREILQVLCDFVAIPNVSQIFEPKWDAQTVFGAPTRTVGEGGSISFMGMLGASFPEAQFVVTGVLGPGSNAHGPNEFLHIPTAKRLTAALTHVLRDHAISSKR